MSRVVFPGRINLNLLAACCMLLLTVSLEAVAQVAPQVLTYEEEALRCPLNSVDLIASEDISCALLRSDRSTVTVTGPRDVQVERIEPLSCQNGLTTSFRVYFTEAVKFNGNYNLTLLVASQEGENTSTSVILRLTDCPITADIAFLGHQKPCVGKKTKLIAKVNGGKGNYEYFWRIGNTTRRGVEIETPAITERTEVVLTATDEAGNSATARTTILVRPLPGIRGGDQTFCKSKSPFELKGSPSGGRWSGNGFVFKNNKQKSLYDPRLVPGNSDIITYTAGGCATRVRYTFKPIDYGTDDAACPGADPFQVSGEIQPDGEWSGPNISKEGIFTPPQTPGEYEVTYTAPNGCTGTKTVNISQPRGFTSVDTLCENDPWTALDIEPVGGTWISGKGIVFEDRNLFDPQRADTGINVLKYQVEGCAELEKKIYVQEFSAGSNQVTCPRLAPFDLLKDWRPLGGKWSGEGIIDEDKGIFDPRGHKKPSVILTYTAPNGCSGTRSMRIIETFVKAEVDTTFICTDHEPIELNKAYIQTPIDGVWDGAGVTQNSGAYYFDPAQVSPGAHAITYTANGCAANINVKVGQSPNWGGDTVCLNQDNIFLKSMAESTRWIGVGVIDAATGEFDPAESGPGLHEVVALSSEGCEQTAAVYVPERTEIGATAPEQRQCFNSNPLEISTTIDNSELRFFVDGKPYKQLPSTADLGAGTHKIVLGAGPEYCAVTESFSISVLPPLSATIAPFENGICAGEEVMLQVIPEGGKPSAREIAWADQPDNNSFKRSVTPASSTTYTFTLSDGCSNDLVEDIPLTVTPEIHASADAVRTVCFGEQNTATIKIANPTPHMIIRWETPAGLVEGDTYTGPTVIYSVQITDTLTGCSAIEEVEIPGYAPVVAAFDVTPDDCVLPNENDFTLIDRSTGISSGMYSIENGTSIPLEPGQRQQVQLDQAGTFVVTLTVSNEGGCTDSTSQVMCMRNISTLFAPTAFTPNNDGRNDFFQFTGVGISELEFVLANRWGKIVYEGSSLDDRWNGTIGDTPAPPAVYTVRAQYVNFDGETKRFLGTVSLIR